MSVSTDIARTYVRPAEVFRRRMGHGDREDRALAVLMAACVLIFIAQWPPLARQAHFDETVTLQALLGATLFAWVFLAPLALYGLAALSHVVARAAGGQGTWYRARFALFWALLAASPLWLLHGLVGGFVGPGIELSIVGFLALAAFLVFWGVGLYIAEWRRQEA